MVTRPMARNTPPHIRVALDRARAMAALSARRRVVRSVTSLTLATLLRLQAMDYRPRPGEPDLAVLYLQALARLDAAAAAAALRRLNDAHHKE